MSVPRGKSSGGGYQSTTGDFVKSLQDMASCGGLSTMCDSVHVSSAVDQLWSEVEGVIKLVNVLMIPFLFLVQSREMVSLHLQETLAQQWF